MKTNETQIKDVELQKKKIRERYKGIDPAELEVIPATPQESFYEEQREKRVAVYARVSTEDPRQTSSYELQKNHYTYLVTNHPNWKLVDIYADEGISGTSLQHRDSFVKMIKDCQDGKIDLIVTKSVSRFARNLLDCIGYVRQLAAMPSPVGVFFETENIYTLNNNSEMFLSFIATMAQEESHTKSEIMNSSIEMRFRNGIFLTPPLLGYDHDEDGNLVINEKESQTVRLIFFMYLYGYTCVQIADTLSKLRRLTKKSNTKWSPNSILQILQNERHCGDILARKTWTPNYLDHKSKKNKSDRPQYRKKGHHEAIISRDDFIAVQHLINNARYGYKGILPELHVINDGALKGFVSINPRWTGFQASDYRTASESVLDDLLPRTPVTEIVVNSGDFDLRGFEIARSQFFDTARKISITFSTNDINFSTECIRKFTDSIYIEMLIHPGEFLFAIRPCTKETKNAVQWIKLKDLYHIPRPIKCAAYIKTLYELFNWRTDYKYRVRGIHKQKDNEEVLIFNMKESEMYISKTILEQDPQQSTKIPDDLQPFTAGSKKNIMAYPTSWSSSFGCDVYRHAQTRELASFYKNGGWKINEKAQPYPDSPQLNITTGDILSSKIQQIILDMEQEDRNNG